MKFLATIVMLSIVSVAIIEGRSCRNETSPRNGHVWCTYSNQERSVCFFRCKRGYKLRGEKRVQCNSKGYWSHNFPICVREKQCPLPPKRPQNGQRICKKFKTATVCVFHCDEGFVLRGSSYSFCRNNRWIRRAPICEPRQQQCEVALSAPLNGNIHCQGNAVGNTCYFECNQGYVLEGSPSSVCTENDPSPEWSESPPTCTPDESLSCEVPPDAPSNGFVQCNNEAYLGSICTYKCEEGYKLMGSARTTCVLTGSETAEWDLHRPECVRRCSSLGRIEHGNVMCSGASNERTLCKFACNRGYQLSPSFDNSLQCLSDGYWNSTKPCCALSKKCHKSKKVDIVIAIDSSTAFGAENLRLAKDFTRTFVDSFSVKDDVTKFSLFRYNSDIDVRSQFLFSDYEYRDQMFYALDKMSDNPEEGTRTGAALRHVRKVILNKKSGDRSDVHNIVIFFTGSASSDDVTTPAEELRSQTGSTNVFVVGIVPERGELDLGQMRAIAGSSQNFFFAEPGIELADINRAVSRRIGNRVCRVQC